MRGINVQGVSDGLVSLLFLSNHVEEKKKKRKKRDTREKWRVASRPAGHRPALKTRGKLNYYPAWRDFPLSPSALQPRPGGGERRGEEREGKSPSLVNFRLKFLPFPGDWRGAGERRRTKTNARSLPSLPKLDFNFRDIINFSRPLLSQPRCSRPPPLHRVSSPPEKKRKRKGRTRYYLEIRDSAPVSGVEF